MSLDNKVSLRPMSMEDLELVLSWRSNPEVYKHFRNQEGPISWEKHLSWFSGRPENRRDFIIEYQGRRVGSIYVDEDNFVGIYIGEVGVQGEGVASSALHQLIQSYEDREELLAEIHKDNEPSQNLFEKYGFNQVHKEDGWVTYRYE